MSEQVFKHDPLTPLKADQAQLIAAATTAQLIAGVPRIDCVEAVDRMAKVTLTHWQYMQLSEDARGMLLSEAIRLGPQWDSSWLRTREAVRVVLGGTWNMRPEGAYGPINEHNWTQHREWWRRVLMALFEPQLLLPSAVVEHLAHHLPGFWSKQVLHNLRMSAADSEAVVYFPDEGKMQRDLATRSTLGRYIARFWPDADSQIAQAAVALLRGGAPNQIKFTSDPEEIMTVYRRGPRSCMSGVPAVRVYGGTSDLSLAYMGDIVSCDGRVTARAVVDQNAKEYVRYYGDSAIAYGLASMGYTSISGWEGKRLRKVPAEYGVDDEDWDYDDYGDPDFSEAFAMPYLDGSAGYVNSSEDGKFWLVSRYRGIEAQRTVGVIGHAENVECSYCEEYYRPNQLRAVGVDSDESVCNYCLERHYVYAVTRASNGVVRDRHLVRQDDTWYSDALGEPVAEHISLNDLGLVQLESGSDAHESEATEVGGYWYLTEEVLVVSGEIYEGCSEPCSWSREMPSLFEEVAIAATEKASATADADESFEQWWESLDWAGCPDMHNNLRVEVKEDWHLAWDRVLELSTPEDADTSVEVGVEVAVAVAA